MLWALLLGCIAAALFLVPRDSELLNSLIADGKHERALELAEETDSETAAALKRDIIAPVAETAPDPELLMDASELLSITLEKAPAGPLKGEMIDRLARVLARAPGTPDEFAHVAARSGDMKAADVERLYGTIARSALGRSDPIFAAEVYTKMRKIVPEVSDKTAASMVQTYRYASQPLAALEVLEAQTPDGVTTDLPNELKQTLVSLYFESSQPGRAFELLRQEIIATKDSEKLAELMPKAVQAASYSGLSDQLVPLLERFLQSMPESQMTLPELVKAGRDDTVADANERPFVHFSKLYAQTCEWSDRYDEGFDYYCKAAALGDEPSLERCIALHKSLFRQDDLGKLMHALAPFEGESKPPRTRLLALLLGGAGRYAEGEAVFEEYLTMVPDDVDALVALAALRSEAGDLRAALETYFVANRERPGDVDLITRTAELHIALGEHQQAFELFSGIPDEEQNGITLEHLLMLSESLGHSDSLNRAQIIAFSRKKEPAAEDYLDLAESYALKGDMENEILVLRGGVQKKPQSTKLALVLADSLYREGMHTEAASLLTRPDLKENVRALAMFIEICGGNDRFAYAMSHLPAGVEKRHYFSPSIRIELGQIYEETGRYKAADELYASVPEGREAWQLLASAKYRQGDLGRAEEYQKKYLRAANEPDAEDWMFMGDIYKSLGKERQADEAYRRSLSMLKSGL